MGTQPLKLLFLGDIVGRTGRMAVKKLLPSLKKEYNPHVVIANVENAAHGKGITKETWEDLVAAGVQYGTSGNHVYSKPDAKNVLSQQPIVVIRPANYHRELAGVGFVKIPTAVGNLLLINLQGQVFMHQQIDSPFHRLRELLESEVVKSENWTGIVVDFHAETTSEKKALAMYAQEMGVTAVLGTHTHVPTADAQILNEQTGFITDIGMIGPSPSVIGSDYERILPMFLYQLAGKNDVAETKEAEFNAVYLEIENMATQKIELVQRQVDNLIT